MHRIQYMCVWLVTKTVIGLVLYIKTYFTVTSNYFTCLIEGFNLRITVRGPVWAWSSSLPTQATASYVWWMWCQWRTRMAWWSCSSSTSRSCQTRHRKTTKRSSTTACPPGLSLVATDWCYFSLFVVWCSLLLRLQVILPHPCCLSLTRKIEIQMPRTLTHLLEKCPTCNCSFTFPFS